MVAWVVQFAARRVQRTAVCLGLVAGALGCAPPPPDEPLADSAILLTIDTWRSDALGAGGDPVIRTPWLDRWFRSSLQFGEAYSPIPSTLPSHTSMLTGAWPTQHGVPKNLIEVSQDLVTVPELLDEEKIATGAFVSAAVLDNAFGLSQGFDHYNFRAVSVVDKDQPWRPAARTLHRALRWWQSTAERKFLWVHVFEPHHPYEPPPGWAEAYNPGYRGPANGSADYVLSVWEEDDLEPSVREHLTALYRAEVTALDRTVGWFLDHARARDSAVIITADHGESLGEHGLNFRHGPGVYPADVHVPLAVYVPGEAAAVSGTMVRTIDVAGTILDVFGLYDRLADRIAPEGEELLSQVHGTQDLPVYGLASQPWSELRTDGFASRRMQRVARDRDGSIVDTPWANQKQYFDRSRDPGELEPRSSDSSRRMRALEARLTQWIENARASSETIDDEELREQVRSLGYTD